MKKGLLIAILVLCVLLLAAGGVLLYLNSIRQDPMQAFAPATPLPTQTPQPPEQEPEWTPTPSPTLSPEEELQQMADRDFMANRVNILLLGWDQSPEREDEDNELYRDENNNFRSDVMMLLSVDFAGTNKLIDDGAIVATKPAQIVSAYTEKFDTLDISKARNMDELIQAESDKNANIEKDNSKLSFEALEENRAKRLENEKRALKLSGDAERVYQCLNDCFLHIDAIIEKTGLPGAKVTASLTQLEVMGLAESASGKRYKLS